MKATQDRITPRLRDLADQLGALNAQISRMESQAVTIKAELAAAGVPEISGSVYRATIVVSERLTLDQAAIRETYAAIGLSVPMRSTFVQAVRCGVAK